MSAPASAQTAAQVTQAAKSNLALAFVALPRERRGDISVFYAFCRLVDDLADEEGFTAAQRVEGLEKWRQALQGPVPGEAPLAAEVRSLMTKYRLTPEPFLEIIAGCEMDVAGKQYETWEELRLYCYRVASVVGLISIEIFGYRNPRCREYATELGLALQVTNIMRDVGEDWKNGGRIYLPREELVRFGYAVEDLANGRENEAFRKLMAFQAERAESYFSRAVALLPPEDRLSMRAAEIMRAVYYRLLSKMRRRRFRVLSSRLRLSKIEKLGCIAKVLVRTWLGCRTKL